MLGNDDPNEVRKDSLTLSASAKLYQKIGGQNMGDDDH